MAMSEEQPKYKKVPASGSAEPKRQDIVREPAAKSTYAKPKPHGVSRCVSDRLREMGRKAAAEDDAGLTEVFPE